MGYERDRRAAHEATAADYRREAYTARGHAQGRARSYGDDYGRCHAGVGGGTARARSRTTLFILIGVAAVVLVAAAAVFALAPHGQDAGSEGAPSSDAAGTQTQARSQTQAGTSQAPDGRIVMTVHGDEETIVRCGESYIEGGCDARDIQEGDISDSVQASGTPDTSTPGDYEVVYTATNAEHMTQTATRKVRVVEDAGWDDDGISVMMYHYVYPDADPPDTPDANLLPASMFEAQLQWLVEEGYYYPSYAELSAYVAGAHSLPAKSVVLTFDDGDSTFFDVVKPLAEKYKVPVTGFIIGNRDGIAQTVKDNPSPYVNYESHSYAMHEDGTQNIGRGGAIYDFDADDVRVDCEREREVIGGYEAFAYPYGDVSDVAPSALAANGVTEAFTIVYGQVHPGDDPMRLKRMRVFGEGSLAGFQYQVEHGPES